MPYKKIVDRFKELFTAITFEQIHRDLNKVTDVMATIASLLDLPHNSTGCEFLVEQLLIPAYDISKSEMVCQLICLDFPWYGEFYAYLRDQILPPNQSNNQCKTFICQSTRYTIIAETLYQ